MYGPGPRRGLAAVLALAVAAAVTVATTDGAAVAAPHNDRPPSVQIGYTDSANPSTPFDAGDTNLPLGTWLDDDGISHTSRVYATFDLAAYEGKSIHGGSVFIREYSAADCTKRAIEIWRTKPIEATPTWRRPPRPLAKVDEILTPGWYCPGADLTFDVGSAVQEAVQKRQRWITFEIRVPEEYESDASYGRTLYWYSSVSMTVRYNSPPTITDHLYNGGFACSNLRPFRRIGSTAATLQVVGQDADEADKRNITTTVAIWPAGRPEERAEFTSDGGNAGRANTVRLPDGYLVDGTSYVWQARVGDGAGVSKWSRRCGFTYDATAPSAPTVTSANYPPSGSDQWAPIGEPGIFTFSGNGDKDVVGFRYSWSSLPVVGCTLNSGEYGQMICPEPLSGSDTVRANAPGGTATVVLNPDRDNLVRLSVRAIDAAGNNSSTVTYEVRVPATTPGVEVVGGSPEWNHDVLLRFTPAAGHAVAEYECVLDGDESRRIRSEEDGSGYFSFLASNPFGHTVKVRSRGSNGFESPWRTFQITFPTWPGVRSEVYPSNGQPVGGVGVTGSFVFSPPAGATDTRAYRYSFSQGDGEEAEVAAGPDGRATVEWTPIESGPTTLTVSALRADGTEVGTPNWYDFVVAAGGSASGSTP